MSDMRGSSALLDEKSRAIHPTSLDLADYSRKANFLSGQHRRLSSLTLVTSRVFFIS
jgi:hypothetical protein